MGLKLKNNASTTLASGIGTGDTSATVASGDGNLKFPALAAGDFFFAYLIKADNSAHEIVKTTARSGDVMTIARAQQGTTAKAFVTGDVFSLRLTETDLNSFIIEEEDQNEAVHWAGTAGGTANAVTLTVTPAIAAYVAGQRFVFKVNSANTGAVTVSVSGMSAKTLKTRGGRALVSGELQASEIHEIVYDGTDFQLATPHGPHADSFQSPIGIDGALNFWDAGTSFTGVTGLQMVTSTFNLSVGTSGTWTTSRSTDVPTVAQAGRSLEFSLDCAVTTADGTVGSNDFAGIEHNIEGYQFAPFYTYPLMAAFWVKSNLTGTYHIGFRNSGGNRSLVIPFTVSSANTWERKTVAISAAPTTGTWDFTTGKGLRVTIALVAGSALLAGQTGSWETGDFIAASGQANLAATVNNFMRIADLQIVPGTALGRIVHRSHAAEYELSRRYYQFARIAASTGTNPPKPSWLIVPRMRAGPTITATPDGGTGGTWLVDGLSFFYQDTAHSTSNGVDIKLDARL